MALAGATSSAPPKASVNALINPDNSSAIMEKSTSNCAPRILGLSVAGLFLHDVGEAQALHGQLLVEYELDPLLPVESELADVHAGFEVIDDFSGGEVLVLAANHAADIGIVAQLAFFTELEPCLALATADPALSSPRWADAFETSGMTESEPSVSRKSCRKSSARLAEAASMISN